jgi:RHS repeat-associated protein
MMDAVCQINLNARIYDPTIGRIMTADPTVPDAMNGQSYNRYSYVDNGPLSATDPSGFATGEAGDNIIPMDCCAADSLCDCEGPGLTSDAQGNLVPASNFSGGWNTTTIGWNAPSQNASNFNAYTFTLPNGQHQTCLVGQCAGVSQWLANQLGDTSQVNYEFPQLGLQATNTTFSFAGSNSQFVGGGSTEVIGGQSWTYSSLGINGGYPTLLLNASGNPVGNIFGQTIMRPSNWSLANFAALGAQAKSLSRDQQLYLMSQFRQGGLLDVQRQNGVFNSTYTDFSTIAIGVTGDAMGWSVDMTLNVENTYAYFNSNFGGNVPMSNIWTSLPQSNVYNTFMGYSLYNTGATRGQ